MAQLSAPAPGRTAALGRRAPLGARQAMAPTPSRTACVAWHPPQVRALPATPHVVQRSQKQAGANEELTDIALSSQVSEQHHRSTTRSECVQAGHRAQCALSSALASHHPRARWTTSLLAVCHALAMPVRAGRTRQQQQAAAATPRIALPHILMCVSVRLVCAAAAGLATRPSRSDYGGAM